MTAVRQLTGLCLASIVVALGGLALASSAVWLLALWTLGGG